MAGALSTSFASAIAAVARDAKVKAAAHRDLTRAPKSWPSAGRRSRCRLTHETRAASRSSDIAAAGDSPLAGAATAETPVLSYLFRSESESDGLVKAMVATESSKYVVRLEVSQRSASELVLNWGMSRTDPIVPGTSCLFSEPLARKPTGEHTAVLEFESSQAPFFLSFALSGSLREFRVPVGAARGSPAPLGVSRCGDGTTNFALFSRNAKSVVLCLYKDPEGDSDSPLEIALDPYLNRTGDTWHISIPITRGYAYYGYRCNGDRQFNKWNLLLDPYADLLGLVDSKVLGVLRQQQESSFDWSGDVRPGIPMEQLVVYRLNVEKFTGDASSRVGARLAGSFAGVVEKIGHLKSLGINAVLLEPIFTFHDEAGPYFPYHFFSPMHKYGPGNNSLLAASSMRSMVKELHASGIEVFLEVAFTHAAEHGVVTFGGIDDSSYYEGNDGNVSAFRFSNPVVQRLVLDVLQHWAVEYRVDGFCFVNASLLLQDSNGLPLPRPPLIEAIAFDPLLSKVKLIADCWSPVDMSNREVRFPHWKRWAEMNWRFRTDVRSFLGGKGGLISSLATRLCGSGDIFAASRGAAFSFNFIAANSGLPLVDLVSFSSGDVSTELSWNCGEEGPTSIRDVLDLRLRQIRNFIFVLFVSLGVPVLNMGDEYGSSTGGSLSYKKRTPFNWDALKTTFAVQTMEFIAFLCSLRARRSDLFQVRNFLKVENIEWYGCDQSPPNWDDPSCKFLAMLLKASDGGDVFIAINAGDTSATATLPDLPGGGSWLCLVDTALSYPGFFPKDGDLEHPRSAGLAAYKLQPHSCALFESRGSTSSS